MLRDFYERYRRDIFAGLVILLAGGAYYIYILLVPGPSQKIRAIVDRMCQAAAKADSGAMLADFRPGYAQEDMDLPGLKKVLDEYFAIYGPTEVSILNWKPNIQGQLAAADARLLTKAANTQAWGGAGAESLWRFSFVLMNSRWLVERLVPVLIMGQEVSGFNFREELRRATEAALERAAFQAEAAQARQRMEREARVQYVQQQREKLLARCPADGPLWPLDDFDEGETAWTTPQQEWAHPCKVSVEEYRGSRRLKVVVLRTRKDKAAIERDIELDLSSRDAICVDVDNLTDADVQLALALNVQEKNGNYEWYESSMKPIRRGINEKVTFDLRANDFKCLRTGWRYTTTARDLDGVVRMFFLIYTARPGVFYFDNLAAVRSATQATHQQSPKESAKPAATPKPAEPASRTAEAKPASQPPKPKHAPR